LFLVPNVPIDPLQGFYIKNKLVKCRHGAAWNNLFDIEGMEPLEPDKVFIPRFFYCLKLRGEYFCKMINIKMLN